MRTYPMVAGPLPFLRRAPRLAQAPGPVEDLAEALRRQGAIVTIQVGVPASLAAQMQGQGQTVPPPQMVKGMVDTGASISTVSEAVAAAAGLQSIGSVPLYGVGGGGEKPLFAASFGLPEYGVTIDPIEAGGVSIGMPGVDILIGRDFLKALNLAWRGPEGAFELTQGGASPSKAGLSTGTWVAIAGGGVAAVVGALFALDLL